MGCVTTWPNPSKKSSNAKKCKYSPLLSYSKVQIAQTISSAAQSILSSVMFEARHNWNLMSLRIISNRWMSWLNLLLRKPRKFSVVALTVVNDNRKPSESPIDRYVEG